jgi:hypothetical protein
MYYVIRGKSVSTDLHDTQWQNNHVHSPLLCQTKPREDIQWSQKTPKPLSLISAISNTYVEKGPAAVQCVQGKEQLTFQLNN